MKLLAATLSTLALLVSSLPAADGPYKADWESLKTHRDPEWFRDAKFGIYTHWGPVTVGCEDSKNGGQWYGKEMYDPKNPVFAYHKEKYGDQHTVGYKDMIPKFTAEKFDAEKWADLFAKAGAKFAGPVAVHHDNFAMWDSAVTPWNAAKMGPKRDITGELAKAYKARGLKFLPTFHHGFAWRYYEPSFQFDAADGKNAPLYTEPHEPKAPPSQRFLDQWLNMVLEVCRKYEPDMIWFDFELGTVITPEYQRKMFAGYYNWAASAGKESAVAHKHREIHQYTGVLDFERGREDRLTPYVWLTDTALGPWFNQKSHAYRTTDNLVDTLVDIVSKNGCMLLNVGPQADGAIPAEAEKMLLELGAWLKVNGEAIYATRPWLAYGEGPTRLGGGGFSEHKDQPFTAADLRFTRSKDGKAVYVVALGWPEAPFAVESMRVAGAAPDARVELIGSPARVSWKKGDAGQLVIEPPALDAGQRPCEHAYAFKLTGFDLSLSESAATSEPAAVLTAKQAVLEGAKLKLQDVGGENVGFWDNPAERVHWLAYLPEPGSYVATLRCTSAYQGNAMRLDAAGSRLEFTVPKTANWTAIQSVRAGEFRVDAPGVVHLVLQSAMPELWKAVNVFAVELTKKP